MPENWDAGKEISGCTTSLTVDTNAKWNNESSGQAIHCAHGPVEWKDRRMPSLITTPWAQLCQPHCCDTAIALLLLVAALQNRLALGTRRSASWVGRHSTQWPCTHWEESGSTALSHGQPSKGGGWRTNAQASWCPSLVPWADRSTLRQALPSACPILPHHSVLLPKDFESVLADGLVLSVLSTTALKCNNRERSTREAAWHKQRAGHCPQTPPLFRALTSMTEITPRSLWNLINFVLTAKWIWNS